MSREQLQNLTEPMYYILLALVEERYGYEIMQLISEKTEGRVSVGPGTLYSLLSRFQKEAIIKQVSDDGRRKTYILKIEGRKLLEEEFNRLKRLVEDGSGVLNIDNLKQEEQIIVKPEEIKVIKKRRNNDILF